MTDEQTITESEAEAIAADEPAPDAGDGGAGKKTLGLERWVQLGYVVTAMLLVWLYQNVISAVWYIYADPNDSLVTLGAVVLGFATTVVLYKHAALNQLSHEVADELSKVTWPTRRETNSHTVVVIITSLIASVFLAFFDTLWGKLTDLIYKV